MSKPVFSDLFSFSGRRNRKSFLLLVLAVMAVSALLAAPMMGVMLSIDPRDLQNGQLPPGFFFLQIGSFLIGLPLQIIGIIAAVQRFHDFGWSGWAVLLYLIPLVGHILMIAVFFIPGTRGPNRYGPDPRAVSTPVSTI